MLANEKGMDVAGHFPMATHVGGVLGVTHQVADHLENVATAGIVFRRYRMGGLYDVAFKTILPLDADLLVASERRSWPLYQIDPAILLQEIASEYLFAEITSAVTESLASENGACLQILSAADNNIGNKLEKFRRQENSLRQDGITSELLDIVTGAEAIIGRTP